MLTDMSGADCQIAMRWELLARGNAVLHVATDERGVALPTTYVSDSFSGIIRAANDLRIGAGATYAILAGEPSGYVLFLSRVGPDVDIAIVSFAAMSAAMIRFVDGSLVWRFAAPGDSFIAAVARMASDARAEYGPDLFERVWGHPFPTQAARALHVLGDPTEE
jgi:hypothetical protein